MARARVKKIGESSLSKFGSTLKSSFKEVWSYGTGKAGLILLIILLAVTIYAAISMPPNYNDLWSNPSYWEEYPQEVPPAWISFFGVKYAKQFMDEMEKPVNITRDPKTLYWTVTYETTYKLDAEDYPQGVLAKVWGIRIFWKQNPENKSEYIPVTPIYEFLIIRPDGVEVRLVRDKISIEGTNITVGTKRVYVDLPLVLRPDNTRLRGVLAVALSKKYNLTIKSSDVENFEMQFLFGQPYEENGTIKTKPLLGDYKIVLKLVYSREAFGLEEAVEKVKFVVKGNAYGISGTDNRGRDLAQGLLYGFPIAMTIGVVTATVTIIIGLMLGVISGYYGGLVDELIQRLVDVMGSIPLLPILILIVNATYSMPNFPHDPIWRLAVILGVLIVFGWGGLAIVVRSMTLSIKEEPYIDAARALGAGNRRIIFKHIIPQLIPYAMASLVFSVPNAILTEAGLSVIGIEHGLPTWGRILADARAQAKLYLWWWIIPPGLLISITSLTFVLLGMAIERIVEPRLRTL
ncbi:ABC transporter permease [Desulfurococcaceae archaeon MEX13E-LK6-19]|nr:ABC transporter permease [Desulfurococcaceae archaeon MEX13E-LK6-19]